MRHAFPQIGGLADWCVLVEPPFVGRNKVFAATTFLINKNIARIENNILVSGKADSWFGFFIHSKNAPHSRGYHAGHWRVGVEWR